MSWKEAMADIADRMERDIADFCPGSEFRSVWMLVRGFASEIRSVVKAVLDQAPQQQFETPEQQHFRMVQQARQEFRARKEVEEATRFADIVDGKDKGTTVPINPEMPVGGKMFVGGTVYHLWKDGRLRDYEEKLC